MIKHALRMIGNLGRRAKLEPVVRQQRLMSLEKSPEFFVCLAEEFQLCLRSNGQS